MMLRLLTVVLIGAASASRPTQAAPPRAGTTLFAAFMSPTDISGPPVALSVATPELKRAIDQRLAKRRSYQYRILIPSDAGKTPYPLWESRRNLEGALTALTNRPDAQDEIVAFARESFLDADWKGDARLPLGEAERAKMYVIAHLNSPLVPALTVFQMHRYRSAFEAAVNQLNLGPGEPTTTRDEWKRIQSEWRQRAERGYQAAWTRMQSVQDVVIRAVADDLDQQPYLYQDVGSQHPRRSK